MMQNK